MCCRSNVQSASSQCHRHQAPLYDSAASAAATGHQVIYASRDNLEDNAAPSDRRAGVTEPLPDLVNVHKPPPSSSTYDRQQQQPTSVIYHGTAVLNHYAAPQPPASSLRSPTHRRFLRGTMHVLILTKFLGGVGTKGINFGDDPDHRPDLGVRSLKSGFTGLSKKYLVDSDQSCIANLHCRNHSAILLCWRSAEVCIL